MKRAPQYRPVRPRSGKKPAFNGRKNITDMYDKSWVDYRVMFLKENPRCYRCGEKSTVVDHLIPHKGDQALFEKLDNHIPLCESCHNTATNLFDRNFKIGSDNIEKIKWIVNKRLGLDLFFKVRVLPKYK